MCNDIFSNPAWKLAAPDATFPNMLARLDEVGAVIAIRRDGRRGEDFALGVAGLDYILKAEDEGRIATAYVVLAREVANGRAFVACEKAREVQDRLRGISPRRDGRFGPYYWVTAELKPAETMGVDRDAPF
jgi:hypothetical protein